MLTFDRGIFFRDFQARAGLVPKQSAKAGPGFLLDEFEGDPGFTQIREVAYVLATIRWETGQAFQPVKEKRANRESSPRLWEIQNRYWKSGFYGRGYEFTLDSTSVTVQEKTLIEQPDFEKQVRNSFCLC